MEDNLRSFLEIPYAELQKLNLKAKEKVLKKESISKVKKYYQEYLKKEDKIKAVTLCFCDIEGRFHMLDYDKTYFLKSYDNLTFDGSSVRGFADLAHSDLKVIPDWYTFRWIPADIFGPGKVLMFGMIANQDGTLYEADIRSKLKEFLEKIYIKDKTKFLLAPELEGFVLKGVEAEQEYNEDRRFKVISNGGYFHVLPTDLLRQFIDRSAEAQRALGFENEKDHPEVAPSQFELNFSYTDALVACDQILLYKVISRQIARNMGMTVSFLPKPIVGINGSGMHTNISLNKAGKNLFYSKSGKHNLSKKAWDFIWRILNHANDICLVLNSSVNSYRRLDPNFEAPNQIRYSPTDRGAMIRIPLANEKSTRLEIRSVGPDANPYLLAFMLLKVGLQGDKLERDEDKRPRTRYLPSTLHDSISYFKSSDFVSKVLGEEVKQKYIERKEEVAKRSPEALGTKIKKSEIIYHHEITNQVLWNSF